MMAEGRYPYATLSVSRDVLLLVVLEVGVGLGNLVCRGGSNDEGEVDIALGSMTGYTWMKGCSTASVVARWGKKRKGVEKLMTVVDGYAEVLVAGLEVVQNALGS